MLPEIAYVKPGGLGHFVTVIRIVLEAVQEMAFVSAMELVNVTPTIPEVQTVLVR